MNLIGLGLFIIICAALAAWITSIPYLGLIALLGAIMVLWGLFVGYSGRHSGPRV